jgi:acyl-CoA thioester hydrolase
MKPAISETVEVEVPFQDLDPMDIAWHGNYFRYFEAARAGLLRRIGYDYPAMKASGYAWPIVETKVKFVRPARYGQRLEVRAELQEWENRLKIAYEVTDAANGERVTTGYTIQCAVDSKGELQLVSPAALRDRVEPFL